MKTVRMMATMVVLVAFLAAGNAAYAYPKKVGGETPQSVKRKAESDLAKTEKKCTELEQDVAAMTKRCEIAEEKVSKLTQELEAAQAELREARAAAAANKKTDELSALEPAKKEDGKAAKD